MTKTSSPNLAQVTYHRIYVDAQGGSHFDVVTVEQSIARAAPPAAPFYVSKDRPASRYRFYTFEPGWIGELHPAPPGSSWPSCQVRWRWRRQTGRSGGSGPGISSCWKIPRARVT